MCTQGDLCPGALVFNGRASCDGPRASSSVTPVSEPETVGAAPRVRESALSSDPKPRAFGQGWTAWPLGTQPRGGLGRDEPECLFDDSLSSIYFSANSRDLGFLGLHFLPLIPAVPWRRAWRC